MNTYTALLWDSLRYIPVNEFDEIETQWEHFEPGTHRETIWKWFESEFNVSVAEMMGVTP